LFHVRSSSSLSGNSRLHCARSKQQKTTEIFKVMMNQTYYLCFVFVRGGGVSVVYVMNESSLFCPNVNFTCICIEFQLIEGTQAIRYRLKAKFGQLGWRKRFNEIR